MTGPISTMTVSPTVKSLPYKFHPSHSCPDLLPGHAQPQPTANSSDQHARPLSLSFDSTPSSSSSSSSSTNLTTLPTLDFDISPFDFKDVDFDPTLPVSKTLKLGSDDSATTAPPAENLEGPRPWTEKMGGRRKSILIRPQSWMPMSSKSTSADEKEKPTDSGGAQQEKGKGSDASGLLQPPDHPRPGSGSSTFASLARRSWMPSSRSPSPSAKLKRNDVDQGSPDRSSSSSSSKAKKLPRRKTFSAIDGEGIKPIESIGKLGTYLGGKMKNRQASSLVKGVLNNDAGSTSSSVASLAPTSTTRPSNAASETTFPSVPDDFNHPAPSPARDPLWSVFRNLDSEYAKFSTKKPADRMKLIRSALLPFLQTYGSHPSNQNLGPEHVEQRAQILDKWWGGLLEMFDVNAQQSISGVDRTTVHEVTTMVMMRPEWRMSTSCFRPLADREVQKTQGRARSKVRARSGSSTDDSASPADSDFITESAEHNVRTMFTTNLVKQMAIVVDKLSQRHVPLTLVNFAGKACAYAFFFAAGISDVLVRLWSLTPDMIRRVADVFKLAPRSKRGCDDIVALFPPTMDGLGWTSVRNISSNLKQSAQLPLAVAKVAWHGPWTNRWRGRDTDLFFVFCKYYFILAEEFLTPGLSLTEKAHAPAFVLVNAQILANLDSTVHRQAAANAAMLPLEDAVAADASAMVLPVLPNNNQNAMKGMNENRLVVLLKDFLSASSMAYPSARHTFAEAFMAMMKASAKRTSLYDQTACFTLCDFLEESLLAYGGHVSADRPSSEYTDWPFWLDVCKRIMQSNNVMSQIRVFSLIYAIWEPMTSNPVRKETVCLDWLLKEDVFYGWFNNWCPTVRAYYMRLLCWRICRDPGSASDLDAKIFLVAADRLKTVWSHYLWLKRETETANKLPPSTAPSWPTPGKRFIIMRLEVPVTQPGLIMGFDSFATPMGNAQPMPPPSPTNPSEFGGGDPAGYKKKWNLFGKVLSFGGNSTNDLESVRREVAAARMPSTPPKQSSEALTPPASDSDSLGSSPTYEALQYVFRFVLSWNTQGTMPMPNKVLGRPRLPGPAQCRVTAKAKEVDGNQPLPTAGRPAPTRAISGSSSSGLIEGAKNANPDEVSPTLHRISTHFESAPITLDPMSPVDTRTSDEQPATLSPTSPPADMSVTPSKPMGSLAQASTYAGRALAEWSWIVAECNSFVDRRRDEGVLGLSDVEIPSLGVEGFRKPG